MSWEVKSIRNYWFFTNLRWLIIDLKVNKVTWPHFLLRLLNFFYLYFIHFWAIETRKYKTNFMISLYWCDLYCISISVTGLFFKRPEYTFDVYLRHFFLQIYRQTRFSNCLYNIYDIYNVLTFLLAFLTHCIRLSNIWL